VNFRADWQQELAQAFRSSRELSAFLGWDIPQLSSYPLLVTRPLAEMIRAQGPEGVLARQFLPQEIETTQEGLVDPIGDMIHAKSAQLIHRYDNRALLIPTTICPVNCRYCFRKNELTGNEFFAQDKEQTLNYLQAHSEIEEVIFTGGDPLLLSSERLKTWLAALSEISHVRFIRFHSRVPVILPTRLEQGLADLLNSYRERFQFIMIVHTNHPSEWSPEALSTVKNWAVPGLMWLAQSVLLKGVNDSVTELQNLFRFLSTHGIRPYYLHHPDQVKGGMHFWLSLEAGRALWGQLHKQVPGWMLPQYVIDIPGGHGKVAAFNPETHTFSGTLLDRHGRSIPATSPLTDNANRI
jgi:lysine 2,3-aminomutase